MDDTDPAAPTPPTPGLLIRSDAIRPDGPIPLSHSAHGDDVSPQLYWSPGPVGTRAYAVIVENLDAAPPRPQVNWVVWNIPGAVTRLAEDQPKTDRPSAPGAFMQGTASNGAVGWSGPCPAPGDPPHRCRFSVFALDALLTLEPRSSRGQLEAAMKGRVLASGTLAATIRWTEPPPDALESPELDPEDGTSDVSQS